MASPQGSPCPALSPFLQGQETDFLPCLPPAQLLWPQDLPDVASSQQLRRHVNAFLAPDQARDGQL